MDPGRELSMSLDYAGDKLLFGPGSNSTPYLTYGWTFGTSGKTLWTEGESFLIRMRPVAGAATLHATLKPYLAGGRLSSQRVSVLANSREIAVWSVDRAGTYSASIPAGASDSQGLLRLEFVLHDAVSPYELGVSEDRRKLALVFYEAVITRAQ